MTVDITLLLLSLFTVTLIFAAAVATFGLCLINNNHLLQLLPILQCFSNKDV